jgi:hypothetical protein
MSTGSINQFLKQITTGDNVKDYSHASELYVSGNYRLAPKYGFLYHVAFELNPSIGVKLSNTEQMELGMLVKEVALPGFRINAAKKNSYNRWDHVNTKIEYEDVRITFHDDSANVVRNFWYDYYSYFFRDSDYQNSVYSAQHRYNPLQAKNWGYTPRNTSGLGGNKIQFIKAIRIYSLQQKRFSEYTLINPVITAFKHGDHRADDVQGLLSNEMTVSFEAVKYASGYVIPGETVAGFGDLHYDKTPSPLTPAGGGTRSILGPGGVIATADSIVDDLADGNIGSAIVKGARVLETFKNGNLSSIIQGELTQIGKDILRGQNPASRLNIPTGGPVGKTIAQGISQFGNSVDRALKQIGGLSPNVSSNGSLLSTTNDFVDEFSTELSNVQFTLPSTSTFTNTLTASKNVETEIRNSGIFT